MGRALTLALLLLASCGADVAGSSAPVAAPLPGRATHHIDSCPLTVDGVRADIETTGRGSTVTLMASPDQLMLLRARAHAVTDAPGGLLVACPCGAAAEAGAPPPSDVSVDDVEGGTRIVVAARDPSDSQALGKLVRTQLALVHGGDCPIR